MHDFHINMYQKQCAGTKFAYFGARMSYNRPDAENFLMK